MKDKPTQANPSRSPSRRDDCPAQVTPFWQRQTNLWRRWTSLARRAKRL